MTSPIQKAEAYTVWAPVGQIWRTTVALLVLILHLLDSVFLKAGVWICLEVVVLGWKQALPLEFCELMLIVAFCVLEVGAMVLLNLLPLGPPVTSPMQKPKYMISPIQKADADTVWAPVGQVRRLAIAPSEVFLDIFSILCLKVGAKLLAWLMPMRHIVF